MSKYTSTPKILDLKPLLRKTNNADQDQDPQCLKRALIVAISYSSPAFDANVLSPLCGTIKDAENIVETLVNTQGYDYKNIRMLVDGYKKDRYAPTKKNILEGISWLVKGCRPNDFRVFYYSGHGCDDPKPVERANRKVYDKNRPLTRFDDGCARLSSGRDIQYSREAIVPADVEWYRDSDSSSDSDSESGQGVKLPADRRLLSRQRGGDQATHYRAPQEVTNQGSATARGLPEVPGWKIKPNTLIFDDELNEKLAKLPESSTITCIFDSCHSGRILSLPFKLGGGGHRAIPFTLRSIRSARGPQSLESPVQDYPGRASTQPLGTPSTPALETGNLSGYSTPTTSNALSLVNNLGLSRVVCVTDTDTKGKRDHLVIEFDKTQIHSANEQPASGQHANCKPNDRSDVDCELVPEAEQAANKVVARMLCWAGSHQRQPSNEMRVYSPSFEAFGFFTKSFCDTLRDAKLLAPSNDQRPVTTQTAQLSDVLTYRQLLSIVADAVDNAVAQFVDKDGNKLAQFVQLWSSLDLQSELDKPFQM